MTITLNARERKTIAKTESVLIGLLNRVATYPNAPVDLRSINSYRGLLATIQTVDDCRNDRSRKSARFLEQEAARNARPEDAGWLLGLLE